MTNPLPPSFFAASADNKLRRGIWKCTLPEDGKIHRFELWYSVGVSSWIRSEFLIYPGVPGQKVSQSDVVMAIAPLGVTCLRLHYMDSDSTSVELTPDGAHPVPGMVYDIFGWTILKNGVL